MAIRPEEITAVIKKQIEGFSGSTELKEEGSVLQVGDGIARVYGIENAMSGELLEFPNGVIGMVLNLEKENVGCVLFGTDTLVKEGDAVRRTGKVAQVPVGDAMIGRVVDALGRPIDGKGVIKTTKFRPLDIVAPGLSASATRLVSILSSHGHGSSKKLQLSSSSIRPTWMALTELYDPLASS